MHWQAKSTCQCIYSDKPQIQRVSSSRLCSTNSDEPQPEHMEEPMKSDRCTLAVFLCLFFAANAAVGQQQLPLFPKYQVLGVIYAPPGNTSSVSYMNSTQIGSSHSIVSDSSTTTTQTQSSTSGFNLFGLGYSNTQTTSDSWISAYENTKSQSLQTTTSNGIAVSGPFSGLGVLHDADLIVLWLNP